MLVFVLPFFVASGQFSTQTSHVRAATPCFGVLVRNPLAAALRQTPTMINHPAFASLPLTHHVRANYLPSFCLVLAESVNAGNVQYRVLQVLGVARC